MKFTATHIIILAVAALAALTACVLTGKLPADVLQAPIAGFLGWLVPRPKDLVDTMP